MNKIRTVKKYIPMDNSKFVIVTGIDLEVWETYNDKLKDAIYDIRKYDTIVNINDISHIEQAKPYHVRNDEFQVERYHNRYHVHLISGGHINIVIDNINEFCALLNNEQKILK